MFSPTVRAPLTCSPGSSVGSNPLYCSMSLSARAWNASRSGLVVLRALVVEAVTDLVPDHGADAAVVLRGVGVGVEERRLQDPGREADLVHPGVVVGVHVLGQHEPLVAVHRRADLAQLAVGLERGHRTHVAEQVVG
jgi:hypothetical protein